jgi:uncharacterized membrane protein YoaK (UPF0700 family)
VKRPGIAALLSFNGGYVDTAGFLGLQGLFTAHVTGNFVTLGAALVFGTHGVAAKLLALPEFILVVALARLVGSMLTERKRSATRVLLTAKVLLLLAFFVLAVSLGPFPDSDAPLALLTGFTAIAAMAIQNAVQRVHFGHLPPSTLMTGNTTQVTLDLVDLLRGLPPDKASEVRVRLKRMAGSILWFALGCGVSAGLYAWIGFWGLAVPVLVGAMTVVLRDQD